LALHHGGLDVLERFEICLYSLAELDNVGILAIYEEGLILLQ
jgi:hypothetical protein